MFTRAVGSFFWSLKIFIYTNINLFRIIHNNYINEFIVYVRRNVWLKVVILVKNAHFCPNQIFTCYFALYSSFSLLISVSRSSGGRRGRFFHFFLDCGLCLRCCIISLLTVHLALGRRIFRHKGLSTSPQADSSLLCSCSCSWSFLWNLVLLICLVYETTGPINSPVGQFCSSLRRWQFCEWNFLGLRAEPASVICWGRAVVLLGDHVALLAVFSHEFKEFLVATKLNTIYLEVVPCIFEERLDVALEGRESLLVPCSALSTNEGAKGHIAVGAPVVLAIDTKGIELLLIDASTQVATNLCTLPVARHLGLRRLRLLSGRSLGTSTNRLLILRIVVSGYFHSSYFSFLLI